MKKFIAQAVLLILVIGVGIFFFTSTQGSRNLDLPFLPQPAKFANLDINGNTLKVEVADTSSKRSKGLGGRETLGENEGMLFIFQKADKYTFWMKGLRFPLDFVWILDDKVVDILTNAAPQNGQQDLALPIYSSKVEVDKVLEVNAGVVAKLDIKVGDTVKIQSK